MKKRSIRRLYSTDGLGVHVFMTGPRWRSHFQIREVPIADVVPPDQISWHPRGKKILMFSLEDECRERMCEEIRPGVFAMWSDPYERWGTRPAPPSRRQQHALATPDGQMVRRNFRSDVHVDEGLVEAEPAEEREPAGLAFFP